jgi:hypothetical protein
MKSIKLGILSVCFFVMLLTSCNLFDPNGAIDDWKKKNESYFTDMKDSAGYVLDTIPASNGGGSYYYKVTAPGDPNSTSPAITDMVLVNYRGKLVNGFVFDETYTGNVIPTDSTTSSVQLYVNTVVRGWTVNLMQMKVGETRSIVLPQELGYGSVGAGGAVSPYSTTIWVVQLLKVYHTN